MNAVTVVVMEFLLDSVAVTVRKMIAWVNAVAIKL